jgi:pentafunctional AROM polypeptide
VICRGPQFLRDFVKPGSLTIISDSNVWSLHGDAFSRAIQKHCTDIKLFVKVIPPGEVSKSRETKAEVEDEMLANKFVRVWLDCWSSG